MAWAAYVVLLFVGLCLGGLGHVLALVCLGIVHQTISPCRNRCGIKGLEVYEFCVGHEWYCQLQYLSAVVHSDDANCHDVMVHGSCSSEQEKLLIVGVQYGSLPIFKCYEQC